MVSITPVIIAQSPAALTSSAAISDVVRSLPTAAASTSALSTSQTNTSSTTSSVAQASTQNTDPNSPSSTFLAQLYGQQDTDLGNVALTTSFARFTPAPTYDTFVSYSFIKYKPSFAGLPESGIAPAQQTDATTTTSADTLQAYSATQSRNQSSLSFASDFQLAIAG